MIQFVQTNIKEILFGFSGIAAVVIVFLIIKMFLFSSPFRSKKLSKYNEILYLKNRNETDKVSFAIRDYLGFDIPEEEIDFAFSDPRNAFMFLTHRKKAGENKVKFENGKYTAKVSKIFHILSILLYSIGIILLSVYVVYSVDIYFILNKIDFFLLTSYVVSISIPLAVAPYFCLSADHAAKQLARYTSSSQKGEKNGTGKKNWFKSIFGKCRRQ